MAKILMPKQRKDENRNLTIALVIIGLFIITILITLFIGYNWGKSNYQKENNATIQELKNKENSLESWAQDLARRESTLNSTEQTINTCYSNLENATKNYTDCKKKLDNPNLYIFNLNYSYNEINILIIAFLLIFPLRFTLVKIIIKDKDIQLIINIASIIIFIVIVISMGLG